MKKFLVVLTICILPILAYSDFNPGLQEDVALPEAGFEPPTQHAGNSTLSITGNMPETPSPSTTVNPLLSISEALGAAQSYVRTKGVDVSGQYIHSVRLNYDEGSRRQGQYWRVQWAWIHPKMGGEYGLRIYTDGTVIPEPSGS